MKPESTRAWLANKQKSDVALCWYGVAALIPIGLMVCFFTFWVIYVILWFGFDWIFSPTHETRMAISGVILGLLFYGNWRTDGEYLEDLDFDTGPDFHLKVRVARQTGLNFMLAFSGPKTARSFIKVLTMLLYSGPRLLTMALRLSRTARALAAIDVRGCAKIISALVKADARVPFPELFPAGGKIDPEIVIPQLKLIDGIVFLASEPAGLTIASELRDEVIDWRLNKRESV